MPRQARCRVRASPSTDAPPPAPLGPRFHRSATRCRVSAPVDLDPDLFLWRPGDDPGPATDGGRADARIADPDGRAYRDGNRAIRAVFPADRCLARSLAKTAGVC